MCFEIENNVITNYKHKKGVTEITIPENIIDIKANTLYNCSSLTKINVHDNNKVYCDIDGILFSKDKKTLILYPDGKVGDYIIPNGVTTIGEQAFEWCSKITSITIPESVTNIQERALYNCSSLSKINVHDKNKVYCDIDGVLFSKDKKTLILYPNNKSGNYTVPDNVTTIVSKSFIWCLRLTSITISESVNNIENHAFEWCSNLKQINVHHNNQTYCDIDGILFSKDKKTLILCPQCKSGIYTIPNSVTTIDNEAFKWCVRIPNIQLPQNLIYINDCAFQYCYNLDNITIPDNVVKIGKNAFYNCSSLTSIIVPDSVTYLGDNAFYGCRSLRNASLPNRFKIFPEHTEITFR